MADRPIIDRVSDVDIVERVIDRLAESKDEADAMRRVLGIEAEAEQLALAYAPEPPLPSVFEPRVDHVEHARRTVARYAERVESYPDDDPTPLAERERALALARLDLKRLEGR